MTHTSFDILQKSRTVLIFYFIQITLIVALLHRLIVNNFTFTSWLDFKIALVFFIFAYMPAYFYAKKDKLDAAANIIILNTTVIILYFTWMNEGVRDEILLVTPVLMIFAVMLGTKMIFKIVYSIIAINILLLGYLNSSGFMHHEVSQGKLNSAILILIILTLITILINRLGNELKNTISELRDHKNGLENTVEKRTQDLKESNKELIEAERKLHESEKMAALGKLMAGVSHEINTPLGIALTAATYLEDESKRILSELDNVGLTKTSLKNHLNSQIESVSLVYANLDRAVNLISDFKSTAVLNSDERKVQFYLNEKLQAVVNTLRIPLLENEVSIKISCSDDIMVYQDPSALSQIVVNMVTNSCKHAFIKESHQHNIELDVELSEEQITIHYKDNGIGLTPEIEKYIFDPFFTTKRNQGGTGLGMHIVYNLVTYSLKGSIHVVPKLDSKGVHFKIAYEQGLKNLP